MGCTSGITVNVRVETTGSVRLQKELVAVSWALLAGLPHHTWGAQGWLLAWSRAVFSNVMVNICRASTIGGIVVLLFMQDWILTTAWWELFNRWGNWDAQY